jgi:hypothetical protein
LRRRVRGAAEDGPQAGVPNHQAPLDPGSFSDPGVSRVRVFLRVPDSVFMNISRESSRIR